MTSKRTKRTWWTIGIIVVFFIALNLALEPVALHYVNKALGNLKGYHGQVKDIDIALYRGAYRIDSLSIEKTDGKFPQPFVNIGAIDISIEWRALFHGAVVGEIILENPKLNFTKSSSGETQSGSDEDWLQTINDLIPISINRFEIDNGSIYYRDLSTDPKVEIAATKLNAVATNLSTVQNKNKKLPSHIRMSANTSGNGIINMDMDLNALKKIPDFDLNLGLQHMDLTYLKDFTDAYANFTFKEGSMDVFSEVAMDNGKYEGYVKPLLKHTKVIDLDNKSTSFWRKVWEVIVGSTLEVFQNQKKDQFATEVPFAGNTHDSNVGILPTIGNVLKNAFIQAFSDNVDQSININSVNDKDREDKGGLFDFLKKDKEKKTKK